MTAHRASKKAKRGYQKHGMYALKRAICGLDAGKLDRRYKVFRALSEWRSELIQDLGGEENLSTQQTAVVDLAARSKLLLDSVDAWLLQQPSLINTRKKSVLPVLRERQQLVDSLSRILGQLGLERKPKPVPALAQYLEEKYGDNERRSEKK
ncbi:MAG: hypothetical protein A3G20_03490 [Acidobacteria bacterium RIFCSPLOWO2_12_FULL_59_11]|nr:MAG: hypothetical protein A3G20_03490 [Acidobacteria bacterium RIFCSPLOWO2_12_FULL_59_11]